MKKLCKQRLFVIQRELNNLLSKPLLDLSLNERNKVKVLSEQEALYKACIESENKVK